MSGNFGDFNFNDDVPGPDTDPTPDENNPKLPNDNKQNDVTNYPEPGEGDGIKGENVSVWDTESNPEEPGAQQDEIPPVIADDTSIFDMISKDTGSVRDMFDVYNALPNTSSTVREMLDAYNNLPDDTLREPTIREMFDAYNAMPDYSASVREMFDAYNNLPDLTVRTPSIRDMIDDYNALPDNTVSVRELIDSYNNLPAVPTIREMLDDYNNLPPFEETPELGEPTPWDLFTEYIYEHYSDFDFTLTADLDEALEVLDAAEVAIINQFENAIDADLDDLDIIPGSDGFANTETNPTGIGELFDRLILEDFDIFKNSEFPTLQSGDIIGEVFDFWFEPTSLNDILFFDTGDVVFELNDANLDPWDSMEDWSGLF